MRAVAWRTRALLEGSRIRSARRAADSKRSRAAAVCPRRSRSEPIRYSASAARSSAPADPDQFQQLEPPRDRRGFVPLLKPRELCFEGERGRGQEVAGGGERAGERL